VQDLRLIGGSAFMPAFYNLLGRGLHSSTFRLKLSAFCGIGVYLGVTYGVSRRCQGVLTSIRGCSGCISCQARLRLS